MLFLCGRKLSSIKKFSIREVLLSVAPIPCRTHIKTSAFYAIVTEIGTNSCFFCFKFFGKSTSENINLRYRVSLTKVYISILQTISKKYKMGSFHYFKYESWGQLPVYAELPLSWKYFHWADSIYLEPQKKFQFDIFFVLMMLVVTSEGWPEYYIKFFSICLKE